MARDLHRLHQNRGKAGAAMIPAQPYCPNCGGTRPGPSGNVLCSRHRLTTTWPALRASAVRQAHGRTEAWKRLTQTSDEYTRRAARAMWDRAVEREVNVRAWVARREGGER